MKKYLIIGGVLLFVLVVLSVASSLLLRQQQPKQQTTTIPTPTPVNFVIDASIQPPKLISVTPEDGASNVSTKTKVTLVFDRQVTSKTVNVWFGPDVTYTTQFDGSVITLSPTTPLSTGSVYSFSVQFVDGSFAQLYRFTTEGSGPISNPATSDPYSAIDVSWEKQFRPDLFIANSTPYEEPSFSVRAEYKETPVPAHYGLIVFLLSDQGKTDFTHWLNNSGLTQQQINNLDIEYLSSGF